MSDFYLNFELLGTSRLSRFILWTSFSACEVRLSWIQLVTDKLLREESISWYQCDKLIFEICAASLLNETEIKVSLASSPIRGRNTVSVRLPSFRVAELSPQETSRPLPSTVQGDVKDKSNPQGDSSAT